MPAWTHLEIDMRKQIVSYYVGSEYVNIYADGGCFNNGTSYSESYGSFLVLADGVHLQENFNLPNSSTNNAAEYESMIMAVKAFLKCNKHLDKKIMLFTDSQLVVNQVNGSWRCSYDHLRLLRDELKGLLDGLKWKISWIPRDMMILHLGH